MHFLWSIVWGKCEWLCSHNEIRRGRTSFYLFDLLWFIFCNCFYFSCGWCDDVVGGIRQAVLDALKLVVMCICVGLWGSRLCKQGAVPFHSDADFFASGCARWNGTGPAARCVLICWTDTLEEAILCDNHRKSNTPNQKMLVVTIFHWAPLLY